jgi:copper chaperone CopZ
MLTQQFIITGMHCQACTKLVSRKLSKIDSVAEVTLDLETGIANLQAPQAIKIESVRQALAGTEYGVKQ